MPPQTPAPITGAPSAGAEPPPRLSVGDRFRLLHAHQRIVTAEPTVEQMARRIAEAAADVVSARAVVLVLLDADGTVEHIVRHGGRPGGPAGGLGEPLGAVTSPAQLAAELDRAGLHHLDGEITATDCVFAHLFVIDPVHGVFDDDDQAMFEAVSRSAGSAISHATLSRRARSSVQWLHASGEIARAMLADAQIDAFTEIVARAVEAAEADYGQLVVPTDDGRLVVLAAHGIVDDAYIGVLHDPDVSDLSRAVVNGKTLRAAAIADLLPSGFDNEHHLGPVMMAPLLDAIGTRGSVLLTRNEGSRGFGEHDLAQFATYAAQVALAMQFADARTDTERLRRVEARANASRELSDIIMQRLFAVGIGLDTLSTALAGTEHAAKLDRHITDLDSTIDEIRQRVFVSEDPAASQAARFPRILLPQEKPARSTGRPRGRRRSDWRDGTGTARA